MTTLAHSLIERLSAQRKALSFFAPHLHVWCVVHSMSRFTPAVSPDELGVSNKDVYVFETSELVHVVIQLGQLTGDVRTVQAEQCLGAILDCTRPICGAFLPSSPPFFLTRVRLDGHPVLVERALDALIWLRDIGAPKLPSEQLLACLRQWVHTRAITHYHSWSYLNDSRQAFVDAAARGLVTLLPPAPPDEQLSPAFTPKTETRRIRRPLPQLPVKGGPLDDFLNSQEEKTVNTGTFTPEINSETSSIMDMLRVLRNELVQKELDNIRLRQELVEQRLHEADLIEELRRKRAQLETTTPSSLYCMEQISFDNLKTADYSLSTPTSTADSEGSLVSSLTSSTSSSLTSPLSAGSVESTGHNVEEFQLELGGDSKPVVRRSPRLMRGMKRSINEVIAYDDES